MKIETPTSVVGVRGTQFRVAYVDPALQNARTEVLEGSVRVDNSAQLKGHDLTQGQGVVLNPGMKDSQVRALLKAPDLSAQPVEIVKPQALWPMPKLDAAKAYRVQVASDERFDKIVRDMVVASGDAEFPNLPNGTWYARVRGIDSHGLEGFDAVKMVQVVLPPPPPPAPPLHWSLSNDRLEVANGHQFLQFKQKGLDKSHTIFATITSDQPPFTRLAQGTTIASSEQLWIDLGSVEASTPLRLHLDVTQDNGARVISLHYRFTPLSGWGWAENLLMPLVH